MKTKQEFRKSLMEIRGALSQERRLEAAHLLEAKLDPLLKDFPYVLSFASMLQEIDLSGLNAPLAKEKRLLLPKIEGDELIIYALDDLQEQLQLYKNLLQPIPHKCASVVPLEKIPCILVPGLGFDRKQMRIGYGKGHYDRLLKKTSSALKIGVGFKEQLVDALPIEPHDQKLDAVYLF